MEQARQTFVPIALSTSVEDTLPPSGHQTTTGCVRFPLIYRPRVRLRYGPVDPVIRCTLASGSPPLPVIQTAPFDRVMTVRVFLKFTNCSWIIKPWHLVHFIRTS